VGAYSTNIVVTGAPGSGYTAVVDGVSNVTVLDVGGYKVLAASYDVLTGTVLMYDNYGNFDGWGRPQQVTHLDGTTEYTEYACCGLDYTTDRDGVTTQYLYDAAHRPAGYEKIYSSTAIIYTNTLDAAGRTVETVRIGTNGSEIMLSGTEYDLADEALAETNALEGVTFRTRTNDATTGGLIRTAVNPDGGTLTNFYYLDGSLKMTVGTSVHGMTNALGVESVSGVERLFTQSFKLNTSGVASSEWKKTDVDMLGRAILTTYASSSGTPSAVVSFNSLGQMGSQKDPDNVATLYAYNPKGELAYTAVDINQNGSIDFSGTDRITFVTNDVTTYSGANVRRSRTYVWGTNSVNSSNLVSMTETSAEGLTNWQTRYRDASTAVVTETITEYSSGGTRLVTVTAPDNSYTINLYSYGWLSSTTRYDSTGAQIGATYYTYDAHGRQATVTDARNGTTSYTYNNADLVASVTTPNPGGVGSAETTTTSYDVMMRATNVVQPDGGTVTMVYLPTGELGQTYGSRTYPVQYTYDYAGRMQTMTNWSAFSGGSGSGARVTTWNYDVYRGFLTSKTDAVGLGPTYTYTAAGRLASRTWARGTNTAYAYNSGGDLATVIYSDSTPSVTYTYDRQGRQSSVVCGSTTTSIAYDWANDVLGESYSGGILGGLTVTNQFDSDLRRTSMALQNTMGTMCQANYGYDDASRLASVSDGNGNSNTYSYLAKSPLVGQITFSQSGTTRMTTTKQYDYLNRLSSIASSPSNSFLYEYNAANQRTLNRCWDGSYWRYGYDALGQVVSGNKYWSDMTPVAGQQFGYAFDTIGNRTQTEAGGDPTGANLRVANYTNNSDNQITSRDVPGYVDIMGNTLATNSVSVNGQPAYQKVEYFRDQFGVTNTSSAQWQRMTVSAPGQGSVTGHSYVAKTPENFTYDADGNLSSDGRWNYTWDAENRLIGMQSLSGAPSGSLLNLSFVYDYQGRRIQKTVSTNNGSYVVEYTDNYAYDGWNCVATLNSSLGLINSFMWGSDLSGSMQGAGGVGGLIEVSYYGSTTTNCFVGYDGNGNVSALVNAADGSVPAQYEYGPFGEVIRATGLAAKLNPFRFSTKYDDDESDLLYYGYRYYNPSTGRWLSRDPIGEKGGLNIYAFTGNNLITQIDSDGRGIVDCLKALADLAKWTAIVDGRVADIIAHGGNPDPGHQKALDQAVTNLNDALRRVAQYCTCYAISAALLQAAAAAIEAALPYLPVLAL
jgi:RHS repeat-associated protein